MLISRVKKEYRERRYLSVASHILDTPPIERDKSPDLVILTQLRHRDVHPYLVAIKSFLYYLGYGNVEVVGDGSLTDSDIRSIEAHIPGVRITEVRDVDVGACPKGNIWERLVRILELAKSSYVIQLDADTITTAAIPEIHAAIQSQSAFCLGNPIWSMPVDASYMARLASKWKVDHVQPAAERSLASLRSVEGLKYCRGCAGFSGFPRQEHGFERLEAFSREMESVLGRDKWSEWGSEQVASNVIVSLSPGAHVLQWPKYQNFGFPFAGPGAPASFYHFLGTHRYDRGVYSRLTKQIISQLNDVRRES